MKTICLIALLLACTMAVQMKRPMTNAQINKFESLKKDNKWAGIMMNLAELHIQAGGPLDELVDAINEVVEDIERKTERAYSEYDRRTNEHNAEVQRIQGQIDSANEDIAHTTEFLNNVLYVQRDNLEQDIVNLNNEIASTQQHILDETALREQNHQNFLNQTVEHEDALEAVAEALEVLSQLFEEGLSLIQVKKAQATIAKAQSKLGNNIEGSLVKALLALSTSQFSDQSDVQKVAKLLQEIQQNLIRSLQDLNDNEERAQIEYQQDMQRSKNNISRMQIELTEKTEALNQTNQSIEDNLEFLAQRQRDLAGYEQDLVDENNNFDRITQLFEELVAQLETERQACGEALDVLNNGDIAGYIGNRMSQDVIIDQPHGSQLTVERNAFDLE